MYLLLVLIAILSLPLESHAQLTFGIRGGGGGASGWPTTDAGDVTFANSLANGVCIGNGTSGSCIYTDSTLGPVIRPYTDSNTRTYIWTNFTWCMFDVEGNGCMWIVDPDAASVNAMYQFQTGYKPVASFYVPLSPRGAATMTETNIVSNQPKGWWGQTSDVDTDGFDFVIPVTAKLVGVTTATVRLWGVSTNASPSGNIKFTCAIKSYRPGTDTYAAHDTTGEQGVTLTPATQYRPVSAVSSAITINGTIAEGAELIGSCESDATGITSAQMTNFYLRGSALVQMSVNSWSD